MWQHGGYSYNFVRDELIEDVEAVVPAPIEVEDLRAKLKAITGFDLPLLIMNKYKAGEGLGAHRDSVEYGPVVAVISLGP